MGGRCFFSFGGGGKCFLKKVFWFSQKFFGLPFWPLVFHLRDFFGGKFGVKGEFSFWENLSWPPKFKIRVDPVPRRGNLFSF